MESPSSRYLLCPKAIPLLSLSSLSLVTKSSKSTRLSSLCHDFEFHQQCGTYSSYSVILLSSSFHCLVTKSSNSTNFPFLDFLGQCWSLWLINLIFIDLLFDWLIFSLIDFSREDVHHLLLWCDLPLRSRALPNGDSNLGNWIRLLCRQVLSLWSSWSSWSLWSPWSLWSSWSTSSISRSWGLGECLPRGWSRLVELIRCLNSLSQVGCIKIWWCWQWRNYDDYGVSIESLSSVWDLCSRWCCSRCLASRDPGQVSTILIRMLVILLHVYTLYAVQQK